MYGFFLRPLSNKRLEIFVRLLTVFVLASVFMAKSAEWRVLETSLQRFP